MNWTRIVLAGLAGGVAGTIVDFIMHGVIMGNTYLEYPVFTQEQANPLYFLLVSVCVATAAAIFYAKTKAAWAPGWKGGATFGLLLGLTFFFTPFYSSLVIEGFPYYLSWCQGGMALIGAVVIGSVIGMVYK